MPSSNAINYVDGTIHQAWRVAVCRLLNVPIRGDIVGISILVLTELESRV